MQTRKNIRLKTRMRQWRHRTMRRIWMAPPSEQATRHMPAHVPLMLHP